MIPIRRPSMKTALDSQTRNYLKSQIAASNKLTAGDPKIKNLWAAFLKTEARRKIEIALDSFTHRKCAYCEQVAAKDIEHFYPKSAYPKRMFKWNNLLRGCRNCNNVKRASFPIDESGFPLLIDPSVDEPLDYFVWDFLTGAVGIVPDPIRSPRGEQTRTLLQLDEEPLREERRAKIQLVLFLLARVIEEAPISSETRTRLRDELASHRPWLGIIRQLFLDRKGRYYPLVDRAMRKVPEIEDLIRSWL